ncbi:MARVEL multi-domain protein [Pyrenophora tritici-repentis]|uniref:MARVEL multi-domain protein n=2 Tax=Pyrenophora tritici-repentis TaxID=45151 RepID=A0A2W1E1I7_9PLEO|nr:uncharacterized protein PTRG_07088 [Pyrenophora tritici-repentis Pt-1C-BFP]KAA8614646.1 MARVEL multi-domain protein [Pyrenophora tritici-repentis]EDU50007.1 conserved hypothetical protein [Pyrenophora tritici-repentis Pt-1C-BFP]KAF7444476.1 MARVEL multi-domain protein [Pyrenophora tritici-repentis]KAF7564872.1 MARVEL multi-domain protein [Pyrenophora tritici-repentis]KAI0570874.1 MARVEL multi-domain protein [Pyrenophora tritici-repentis]
MAIANPLLSFVVRGLQAVFGIVVLGISVSLVRGHHWGSLPATLGFSAFVGGITILGAALGVAGIFLGFLDGTIAIVVDAVIALINLACGVLLAIKVSGADCDMNTAKDADMVIHNNIFNGGCRKDGLCWCWNTSGLDTMKSRCISTKADCAFMFLTVVVIAVAAMLVFLRTRK